MVSPFLQKCNYATLAPQVGFGFKLQQTALHCQQPCGGLFNLLYPVITMGFFLAWQDSLANRTWKVSGTHSTSLAKLQNTWLAQVISQFPNDKKQEKQGRARTDINPCAPFGHEHYPNRGYWDESENMQSLYTSLKLLPQSEIRNNYLSFWSGVAITLSRLDCYFTLSCKEMINMCFYSPAIRSKLHDRICLLLETDRGRNNLWHHQMPHL